MSAAARQMVDRCLAASAPLFCEAGELDRWLTLAAGQIVSFYSTDRAASAGVPVPVGAWAAVVEQGVQTFAEPGRVLGVSISGYAGFSPEQTVDIAATAAVAAVRGRTRASTSDAACAIATSASTTAQPADEAVRATTPLGAFIRAVSIVPAPRATRFVIWQIDGRAGQWVPSQQDTVAAELLGSCLARAYALTHIRRERHRASLIAAVSVSQAPLLPLLAEGMSQRQISERTGRSMHTVHDHVKGIYGALGIRSRHQLYVLWNGGDPTRVSSED